MDQKDKTILGWREKIKFLGPAALITGSFIGPGTITTATRTGAEYGYTFLWTIAFAIIATIILQEMSARLGIVTRRGLSEAISSAFKNIWIKKFVLALVCIAVPLGCVAYMGGDLTGSAAGLSAITGVSSRILGPLIGIAILMLLYFGPVRILEKLLMVLVGIMAIVFLVAMFAASPDLNNIVLGLRPTIPDGGLFLAIGLIGTTIVPYNFFVHAVNAKGIFTDSRATVSDQISISRWDILISISIGGVITSAVLVTAASVMQGTDVDSVTAMSFALEPLLGRYALPFLSIGLFAAGISSAIVTPLGASYVLAGLFGWEYDTSDKRFLAVNVLVLLFGIIISATGFNPVYLIISAQALNGVILPLVVILLVYITSRSFFMDTHKNTLPRILLGIVIGMITLYLGGRSLMGLF